MREYADMVQLREPEVDDIIGFMGGVSFLSDAQTSGLSKTLLIVVTIATQWLITSLHLFQMVRYFLLPLIFLGVGRMLH